MKKSNYLTKEPQNMTISRRWEKSTADNLIQWAQQDDAYMIEDFFTSRQIPERTYYDAVKRDKDLNHAHEYAKLRCGINREKKCIKENLGVNSVTAYTLSRYFDRWKEELTFRSQLKEENKGITGPITIKMEKFGDSSKDDEHRNGNKT